MCRSERMICTANRCFQLCHQIILIICVYLPRNKSGRFLITTAQMKKETQYLTIFPRTMDHVELSYISSTMNRSYKYQIADNNEGIICSAVVQTFSFKHINFISSVWTQLDVDADQSATPRNILPGNAAEFQQCTASRNHLCFRAKLCVVTLWDSVLQGVHCTTPTATAARSKTQVFLIESYTIMLPSLLIRPLVLLI